MDRQRLAEQLQLYVVTDERKNGKEFLPIIRAAAAGGATSIQLRRKQELGREFVELGRAIRDLTKELGMLFFVNDRIDVAMLVEADGVHIGQDDISCRNARQLLGTERLIGVSAHTVEEALLAEQDGADYLGVGAVYTTQSKSDAEFTGLDGLAKIVQSVRIPVVGIGGIHTGNVAETIRAGAVGAAIVSAVMSADDPQMATSELKKYIQQAQSL